MQTLTIDLDQETLEISQKVAKECGLTVEEYLKELLCDDMNRREEGELVSKGLMRLPLEEKNDDFLDLPAPQVEMDAIQKVVREERDEE